MKNLKIGICGWGNVATGLYKILKSNSNELYINTNINVDIVVIGARKDNPKCDPEDIIVERNIFDVLDHDIDVLVELIGGISTARELILKAISKGIHVVTANKAVLYHHGDEIFTLAKKNNVNVLFESSVCAGTPIIKMLKEELAANKVSKISGMLNGTSNFILSQMEEGEEFESTLSLAQSEGYAEPDPSFDIDGLDAAHKIGILSSLAFGTKLPPEEFHIEGITKIDSEDFKFASEQNYSIKHLAIASELENTIDLRVHPVIIDKNNYLANLKGVRNGIEIETDLLGTLHVAGSGAGQESTASGIISDLVCIANSINGSEDQNYTEHKNNKEFISIENLSFKNYFHIKVKTDVDEEHSIKELFQKSNFTIKSISKKMYKSSYSLFIITGFMKETDKYSFTKKLSDLEYIEDIKSIRIES